MREEDLDGVVHLFTTYVGSVPYGGTPFERRVFRAARSVLAIDLLLSFGNPSFYTLEFMVMCWAVEGRSELLQVFCDRLNIPGFLVGCAIYEIRSSKRGDWKVPEKYLHWPTFWEPLDIDVLLTTNKDVLMLNRHQCLKALADLQARCTR